MGFDRRTLLSWVVFAGCAGAIVRNERAGLVVDGPLAGPFDTPEGAYGWSSWRMGDVTNMN